MKHRGLFLLGCLALGMTSFSLVLAHGGAFYQKDLKAVVHEHHVGNHYIGQAPTCTEDGAAEYWVCCECHQAFFDADSDDVLLGQWTETGTTGASGVGGLTESAVIPALGHDWVYHHIDLEHHEKTCSRCGAHEEELHSYSTDVVQPQGLRRGYTLHECQACSDRYYEDFDFSLYEGATFTASNKHLIPYSFTNRTYTINASINLPTSFSSRGGVIVGSYGISDSINLEIHANGHPRLYFTSGNTYHDIVFDADIRSDDSVVNMAVTIESEDKVCLYIDGVLRETKAIDFVVPKVGRQFAVGGDYRNLNSMYFRGTLYALSIYKDIRTPQEMINDIIFPDEGNADHCVSYNLVDYSYFDGGSSGDDPLEYAEVATAEELSYQCSIGTKEIKVVDDIVLEQPIYLGGHVTIYSDDNHTISRDPSFAGDLFVVGENAYGRNLVLDDIECILSLGKADAEGLLTIDGNKENVTVDVNGALVYVSYSGKINLNENAKLANNKKTGNSRSFALSTEMARMLGGAGVLVTNGTFNMYGGEISGCETNTVNIDEDSSSDSYMASTLGGAICNYRSNFNMYGGVIDGNKSYYGGAMTNDGVSNFYAGTISNNSSTHAGGAVYQYSDHMNSITIGDSSLANGVYNIVFDGNSSDSYSGAVYAGLKGTIEIVGGAKFINNHAASTAGAVRSNNYINIEGDNLFKDNSTNSSGGALFIDFQDPNGTTSRCDCTVSGATFEGNSARKNGGAFVGNGSKVAFSDCVFTGNTALGNGGASYATTNDSEVKKTDSIISFDDCAFDHNSAKEAGAVYVERGATVNLSDSSLTNNTSSTSGGAVSMHGAKSVRIDGCTLDNNQASTGGGAVYVSYRNVTTTEIVDDEEVQTTTPYDSKATILDSSFSGNTAATGGAICTYVANAGTAALSVSASTFEENAATGNGGAIYHSTGRISLVGNTFTDNAAGDNEHTTSDGGAVNLYLSTGTLSSNIFETNTASRDGGAVFIKSSEITASDNSFNGNTAVRYGGGLDAFDSSITLNGDGFDGNEGSFGGGLYLNNGTLIGTGVSCNSNIATSASYGGGALYATGGSTASLSSSSFTNNQSANGYGGAIEAHVGSAVTLMDVQASGNSSALEGGFAFLNNSSLTVTGNSTIGSNTAGTHGGAISGRNGAVISLTGAQLSNNTAGQNGGACYINGSTLTGSSDVFSSNTANSTVNGGGAIYGTTATVNLSGDVFRNNTALNGGAVCGWTNSNFTLSGVTGEANAATSCGGFGYAASGATIVVNGNSTLGGTTAAQGNSAQNGGGGALYSATGGTINVSYTTIRNNATVGSGAALYAKDGGVINVSHCTISDHNGIYGGALTVYGGSVSVDNTVFANNHAIQSGNSSGFGGVAYIRNGTTDSYIANASFVACTFENNDSVTQAGAIYLKEGNEVVIDGCSFIGNAATIDGGAIYTASGASLRISDTEFTSNSATSNGGAIYLAGAENNHAQLSLEDVTFNGNSATNGGAIYLNQANVTVASGVFENNTATNNAGVFYVQSSSLVIESIDAHGNTATVLGGVFYVNRSVVEINLDGQGTVIFGSPDAEHAETLLNSAQRGGVIYATVGADITINDATFGYNHANDGGVILGSHASGSSIVATNSTFVGNSAKNGGVAYGELATVMSFEDCTFTGNRSTTYGGAIYAKGSAVITTEDCSFASNTSNSDGGVLYFLGSSSYSDSGSSFTNNSSSGGGGVLRAIESTTISFSGSSFVSNTSSGNGGAIYLYNDGTHTNTLTGCTFSGNTANGSYGGGAIYHSNASVTIIENTIIRNNSGGNGSAINATNGSGKTSSFTIRGTYTTSNSLINVGAGCQVTINANGLDDEDHAHASNTWSDLVRGATSNVTYI